MGKSRFLRFKTSTTGIRRFKKQVSIKFSATVTVKFASNQILCIFVL